MYFPTKMFGISILYLQAFDFFGYFFNIQYSSTLSFCFLSLNIALIFCLSLILILFPVIFTVPITAFACCLEHRGISLYFLSLTFHNFHQNARSKCQSWREIRKQIKSFRLFFSCCCCMLVVWTTKIKKTNQGETTRIEKIGIEKTRENFSTGWLEKGERKKEERRSRARQENNDQKRWHFRKDEKENQW